MSGVAGQCQSKYKYSTYYNVMIVANRAVNTVPTVQECFDKNRAKLFGRYSSWLF